MKTFFTSDTHFQHLKIFDYCPGRLELSAGAVTSEMDDELVRRWNSVVSADDVVYHLGDFAFGPRSRIPEILARLSGTVRLVAGNHDFDNTAKHFSWFSRSYFLEMSAIGVSTSVELVHDPSKVSGRCSLALCGHVHDSWRALRAGELASGHHGGFVPPCDIINVGVDVWGFAPRTIEELAESLARGG